MAATADPQQQQMQQMMSLMMPVMMALVLRTFPSALVLYWFFFNVFSTIHQLMVLKKPMQLLPFVPLDDEDRKAPSPPKPSLDEGVAATDGAGTARRRKRRKRR